MLAGSLLNHVLRNDRSAQIVGTGVVNPVLLPLVKTDAKLSHFLSIANFSALLFSHQLSKDDISAWSPEEFGQSGETSFRTIEASASTLLKIHSSGP
ncbi:hypothetical protein KCV03_g165, partial [Aureobasidium melanogenum]